MKNQELAQIFHEIALFLEMEDVPFKPQAYEKVALTLENLPQDIEEVYKKRGENGIKNIPGVGEHIAQKIIEYLKTGKIKYYEDYKKKYPINLREIVSVEGVGPKMAKALYENLGIRNLRDLEKAAREGKIKSLRDFGETTEKNILEGIAFLRKTGSRFLLGEILPRVREIERFLRNLEEVENVSVCGSVRRMKETIGDIDFLVSLKPSFPQEKAAKKVMGAFCSLQGILKVLSKGETRSSIRLKEGFDVDLRVMPSTSYGAALQYFTGSKEHNIHLRKIAQEKGFKINEYGIFKGTKKVGGEKEEEIYRILGMACPPPEIRENKGEIEAAIKGCLPKLVRLQDIKGDLHCHSNWDGGKNTILEMAEAAIEMGYEYLGISDHTKFLKIEKGLDEKQLLRQRKEIDKINSNLKSRHLKFKILHGCEANIMPDGSIDIKDEALKKLDYAIAGVHSNFKMRKEEMTERIIKAMKNPYINIISHPTGRLLQKREEYALDFGKILRAAKETGTILEINSSPQRLDLNDEKIRMAKEMGVKLVINTDSHQKDQLKNMEFGVSQARRGWAEKKDILNTLSGEKLIKILNNNKS